MKNYLAVFAAGILLGFLLGRHQAGKTPEPVAQQEEAAPAAPPIETPAPVAAAPTPPPQEPTPIALDPRNQVPPIRPDHAAAQPNPAHENVQLSIDDGMAARLEDDWDDLPNQIHVMREERGYRVVYIKEGSLMSQTGLHNGDLITRESLDALGGTSSPLAQRVARILGHVSVY